MSVVYLGFWSLVIIFGNLLCIVVLSRVVGFGVSDNCFIVDLLCVCRMGYVLNLWEVVVRNDDDEYVKSGGWWRCVIFWVEIEKERMKVLCLRLVEVYCLLLLVLVYGIVVGCVYL